MSVKQELTMVFGSTGVLLLLLMSSAHAQGVAPERRPRVVFGSKIGTSIATQETEGPLGTNLDAGNKVGLAIGAAATLGVYQPSAGSSSWLLAVQPEILFASEGMNIDRDGETLGAYHLSYIEIPLMARVGVRVTRDVSPYVLIGPQLGILLAAEFEDSGGEFDDIKDGLKTADFGLLFGTGVSLDVAAIKGALNLEARYDLGLTDINDAGAGGFVKNRAFFVLLGYQYGVL
jgi:opacity protein-like surface antigen